MTKGEKRIGYIAFATIVVIIVSIIGTPIAGAAAFMFFRWLALNVINAKDDGES